MAFWNEWKDNIQGYNRNIRLFLWSNFLFQIGMGIFMVMYNLYIVALDYGQVVIGNIIAVTSLAAAVILIPAGIFSDKIGRKNMIIIGGFFTVISFFLRSILEGETSLIVTAAMTGLFSAFIQVSAIPFLSENSTKEQRVHLFSFNFGLMMVANVIGNSGGGFLTDFFHHIFEYSEVINLRLTLIIGSFLTLASIIPMLFIREVKKKTIQVTEKGTFNLKDMISKNKKSLKVIGLFAVAQMLIGFGAGLVIPYLNVYFTDRFDASKSAVGIVVSLGQAATAVAMFIGPMLVRKIGQVKSVVVLQLCSIPFLLITGFSTNFYLASTGFLFRQALMNAGNPIQMSIMMEKVDDSMKGLANSVGQTIFMLGWALMGPVSTAIVASYGNYWGYAYVFSITAFLYVIGSVFFYVSFAPKKEVTAPHK